MALGIVYRATGYAPLLAAIVVQHLAMEQQFLPFVRLDGYYVVSDLAGVPDLFGRARPTLRGLRRRTSAPDDLTPRARFIVTLWVLSTVPLLAALAVALVLKLPGFAADGWKSLGLQAATMLEAVGDQDPVTATLALVQLILVGVPLAGLGGLLLRRCHRRRPTRVRGDGSATAPALLARAAAQAAADRRRCRRPAGLLGPGLVEPAPALRRPALSAPGVPTCGAVSPRRRRGGSDGALRASPGRG